MTKISPISVDNPKHQTKHILLHASEFIKEKKHQCWTVNKKNLDLWVYLTNKQNTMPRFQCRKSDVLIVSSIQSQHKVQGVTKVVWGLQLTWSTQFVFITLCSSSFGQRCCAGRESEKDLFSLWSIGSDWRKNLLSA